MNGKLRRTFLIAPLMLLVASAGMAWACTPQQYMSLNPNSAPAGSRVVANFESPLSEPVDIRWNSDSGPLMGSGAPGAYSVSVNIPSSARPDFYTVLAIGRSGTGRAGFTVIPGQPANYEKQNPSERTTPSDLLLEEENTSGDSPADSSVSEGTPRGSTPQTSAGRVEVIEEPVSAKIDQRPATSAAPAPSEKTGERPQTAAQTTGPFVSAESSIASVPPAASVSSDLWSGFSQPARGMQLEGAFGGPAGAGGPDPALLAGLTIVGVGMVGLGAFAGIALAKRKSVRSGSA